MTRQIFSLDLPLEEKEFTKGQKNNICGNLLKFFRGNKPVRIVQPTLFRISKGFGIEPSEDADVVEFEHEWCAFGFQCIICLKFEQLNLSSTMYEMLYELVSITSTPIEKGDSPIILV